MSPIVCRACGTRFPTNRFTEEECQSLAELYHFNEAAAELLMLRKVEAFYLRHPYAEGKINPLFIDVMDSDDPRVEEQRHAGVPFNEIELPAASPVVVPRTAEDAEVIDYLQHHHFDLQARLSGIAAAVEAGRGHISPVQCPHCQTGELFVPPDQWWEFESRSSTTFYWPDWHSVDDDGVLHVRTSGYVGMSHWSGETTVKPADPDYTFWRWFVAQSEHHHLMQEEEFEQIRTAYNSRATQSN